MPRPHTCHGCLVTQRSVASLTLGAVLGCCPLPQGLWRCRAAGRSILTRMAARQDGVRLSAAFQLWSRAVDGRRWYESTHATPTPARKYELSDSQSRAWSAGSSTTCSCPFRPRDSEPRHPGCGRSQSTLLGVSAGSCRALTTLDAHTSPKGKTVPPLPCVEPHATVRGPATKSTRAVMIEPCRTFKASRRMLTGCGLTIA